MMRFSLPFRSSVWMMVLLLGVAWHSAVYAQEADVVPAPDPRPSPLMLTRTTLDDGTYVKVHYSSPRRHHPETGELRQIFGGLVPYGEVWRTAANEASEITFTEDVTFGGQPVEAGTYSLFTIPGPEQWTVILNRGLGLNGTQNYDAAKDAARVVVPSTTVPQAHEAFTISFDEAQGGADMNLVWDRTSVTVPIRSR